MAEDVRIRVFEDTGRPAVRYLREALTPERIRRVVGRDCARLTQDHLRALGPNKRGWPSTKFYDGAARGTSWDPTPEGITISIENEERPGAMRQRFHGGTIKAKDHLLTIPARQEFYGHRATEFTNLRFVAFKSGAMALVVGKGGVGRVNFQTGRERSVKGAGTRAAAMVAYWLRDEVHQEGDPGVIPSESEYADAAVSAVIGLVQKGGSL